MTHLREFIVVALLLLVALSLLPGSAVVLVAAEKKEKAKDQGGNQGGGGGGVRLTLRSELPGEATVYWVGHDGSDPVPQGTVAPHGGELTINTFPGHTFLYEDGPRRGRVVVGDDTVGDERYVVLLGDDRDHVRVRCSTSVDGNLVYGEPLDVLVMPSWSPRGAARFLDLVRAGYYDGAALTRVVPRFLTQFGIGADSDARREWRGRTIPDDPPPSPRVPFRPGMLSYAGSGPNSRTTEVFVVMPDTPESQLRYFGAENPWETPFAVVDGNVEDSPVSRWYSYGDMPPWGEGPDPRKIYPPDGYEYLAREFPWLDYIAKCVVMGEELDDGAAEEL